MTNSTNPLAKHFRQPQLYLKLPSEGKWYPAGSIEMPATGELPVYAMTAKDELVLKTPDALMNGQATVEVIQSCVPNIKDAWKVPAVDLDAILIAIRQATFGNRLDFVSICPHCTRKNEHALDLGILASTIACPKFDETLKIDGMEFFLRPQTYREFNRSSMESYEQQRLIAVVNDETLAEDEKMSKFNLMFKKLLELTVEQVSKSVAAIKLEDGQVVEDPKFIDEYFTNCNRHVWDSVKSRLESFSNQNPLKKIDLQCEHDDCNKEYFTPLIFENSSFFV